MPYWKYLQRQPSSHRVLPPLGGNGVNPGGLPKNSKKVNERGWPGGWGPQGMSLTSGGGLARVPNLRVYDHLSDLGWHTQGVKDELTSCRGSVQSAWQKNLR